MLSARGPSLALALVLAACGGSGGDDDGGGGGDGDGGGDLPDATYGDGHTVSWGPVNVEPGVENTQCVVKRLGNDGAIRIGQIHNQLGLGSHHLIVYRLSEGEEQPEPFDCDPFADVLDPSAGAPLAVTQKAEEVITLPPGVAFTLAPDQLVRLEMHYINASAEPITMQATSTFVEIPDADFRDEADFLFIGNPDIEIPPHQSFTLGPSFLPLPDDLADINVFALTGHEHKHGTGVTIATASDADDAGTTVYDPPNFKWDEPPTVYPDPPFQMTAGTGFRFTCTYMNTSNESVGFGESANDEMCFFWAYYYPSQGAKVCFHTDQLGGHDICCPSEENAQYCQLIQNYLGND